MDHSYLGPPPDMDLNLRNVLCCRRMELQIRMAQSCYFEGLIGRMLNYLLGMETTQGIKLESSFSYCRLF
jgi:hypothetical protein